MWDVRCANRIFVGKSGGKMPLGKSTGRYDAILKSMVKKFGVSM
jgi:hypothetical protein